MILLLNAAILLAFAQVPAPAPAPAPVRDAETQAFDAAFALKKQQKPAQAAAAFEEIVRNYPDSPRVGEALVEAGVGWFGHGREKMVMNRATPASDEAFAKATKIFGDFVRDRAQDGSAGRSQYMLGSTHFFLGDLAAAEVDYGAVLEKFPKDAKYVPKSLERRSAMRRHLLENDLALADLQRYSKDYPKGEDAASVEKYLQFASMFDKPSPAWKIETWIQGGPVAPGKQEGTVVGLLFFSTWCENCEKQRPFLLDLVRRYGPSGFVMVGVMNHSQKQTVDSVRAWLGKSEIPFPVFMDADQATAGTFHASTTPDLVLFDKAGKVRWHDNPTTLQDYTLETLLAENAATPATPPK